MKLEGLEDCHILCEEDDSMFDTHGCPAYVSPEILNGGGCYSGKQADAWSLGVMLYTMLVGRYPFHDPDPATLFSKIRRGTYCLPDGLSLRARLPTSQSAEKGPGWKTDHSGCPHSPVVQWQHAGHRKRRTASQPQRTDSAPDRSGAGRGSFLLRKPI